MNIRTNSEQGKHCRICGNPISAPPFAQGSEEACYLQSQAAQVERVISMRADAALAEALAAALDLREHETGLHSKRVACHTLELARRFIHDAPEYLRQIYWGALLHDIGRIGIPARSCSSRAL